MIKITKREFKLLHEAGMLELIVACGTKNGAAEVAEEVNKVKDNLKKYCRPVSRYGNISNTKDGYQKVNIYMSDDRDFIFLVRNIDNSKCKTCSWNTQEVYTSAYHIIREPKINIGDII
jgi:hypothetical protein